MCDWSGGEVVTGCYAQTMADPTALSLVPLQFSQQAIPGLGPQRVHLILPVS